VTLKLQRSTAASHKGRRDYQEDRLFTANYEQGTLLAVFDGHGGHEVSELCENELPGLFADEIGEDGATNHVDEVLRTVIQKLNIMTQHFEPGSTLSLAFIPVDKPVVTCAVMGDSPILIKDKDGKVNIAPDHNVRTNQEEAQAAIKRGGFVEGGYLYQDYHGMGLQMARALGDSYLNKVLSRTPEIYEVEVGPESWVLVASDGQFDPGHYEFKKSAQTIAEMIDKGSDAKALVQYAAVDYPTGDNVSAVLARFEANETE
jgi:serine/threonine protein phosphatase PrpC